MVALLALALPILGMRTGMPWMKVVPKSDSWRVGYEQVSAAFGPGAPGTLQVTAPRSDSAATAAVLGADQGIAMVSPPLPGAGGAVWSRRFRAAAPRPTPPRERWSACGRTFQRRRSSGVLGRDHDLEASLAGKTPLAIDVILALGFLLLSSPSRRR